MPRGKKNGSNSESVAQIIEKFSTGLRDDLSKLYQMGFTDGATSERKRMAALFTSGESATQVTSKSDPVKKASAGDTPKKKRKNPWASYTPEQKAARLTSLAEARGKRKPAGGTAVAEEPVAETADVSSAVGAESGS